MRQAYQILTIYLIRGYHAHRRVVVDAPNQQLHRCASSLPSDSRAFLPVLTSTTSSANSTFRLPLVFVTSSTMLAVVSAVGFFRLTRFERSLAPLDASSSRRFCAAGDSPIMEPRIPPKGVNPSSSPLFEVSLMETGGWRSSIN